jgi:hypothetical protein
MSSAIRKYFYVSELGSAVSGEGSGERTLATGKSKTNQLFICNLLPPILRQSEWESPIADMHSTASLLFPQPYPYVGGCDAKHWYIYSKLSKNLEEKLPHL